MKKLKLLIHSTNYNTQRILIMNDLTIVLPLKDKSNFTYRWMKYAEKNFQDYKIIIADGGKDKEVETILSNKSNYNKIDYQ